MRTMTRTLCAAVVAGLLAIPALAQSDSDYSVGANVADNAGLNFDTDIPFAFEGEHAQDEVPAPLVSDYSIASDAGMIGTKVVSSDGTMIGTISNVYTSPEKPMLVSITPSIDGFNDKTSIFYPLDPAKDVQGELKLDMTLAQLRDEFGMKSGGN